MSGSDESDFDCGLYSTNATLRLFSKNLKKIKQNTTNDNIKVKTVKLIKEPEPTLTPVAVINIEENQPAPQVKEQLLELDDVEMPCRITRSQQRVKSQPPPALKRKPLKKINLKKSTTVEEVITLNDDSNETIVETTTTCIDDNYEITVKVLWASLTVKRFEMRRYQPLAEIFEYFQKVENVPPKQILMTLHNKIISPTDTPDSLNIQVLDFIEGGIVEDNNQQIKTKEVIEKGVIAIKLQENTKKVTKILIRLNEPMRIAMIKYAEQTNRALEDFKFLIDGDVVNPNDTAALLEIEHNDTIDVKIFESQT